MKLDLRMKIVSAGICGFVAVAVTLNAISYTDARHQARQLYVEKARSVILAAESAREEMASKWDLGLFSKAQLKEWALIGQNDRILAAVPVVTAWKTSMAKAAEGGYTFKVPKFELRNPENQPDAVEAAVLKHLESTSDAEYFMVDNDINAIRYFRPIRLTAECLYCHGDPASSAELWGNTKGLDPTGARMENWKVGELHGAFEVVQSLDRADAMLRPSLVKQAGGTLILLLAGSFLFYRIVTRSVVKPVRHVIGDLGSNSDGVSSARQHVADSSTHMEEGAVDQAARLQEIAAKVAGVGELAAEVDGASRSQAQKICEITVAVSSVDAITQDNAASAEESAAASEELSAQTAVLQGLVEQLTAVVDGSQAP